MSRKLTKREARRMNAMRQVKGGGRPRVPTACPKCGATCESYRRAHCHC